MDLSIVMPAYGEAENLRIRLPQIAAVCRRLHIAFEILVVDTMTPTDDTPAVCRAVPETVYLPRAGSNNYGDAIRTGIARSQGEYVVIMDADGSHAPEFIAQLWERRTQADLVIASRYVPGGRSENSLPLHLMSKVLNITYRLCLGIPCADISNSFRCYRGAWLRSLHLVCDHFDIVEEILIKLSVQYPAMRLLEIPFVFRQRDRGVTKRNLLVFVGSYIKTMHRLRQFKRQEGMKCAKTKEGVL